MSEYSEETEGLSTRASDPLSVGGFGTVEEQTVGSFRLIPRMMADTKTTPKVVIFLMGESPDDD